MHKHTYESLSLRVIAAVKWLNDAITKCLTCSYYSPFAVYLPLCLSRSLVLCSVIAFCPRINIIKNTPEVVLIKHTHTRARGPDTGNNGSIKNDRICSSCIQTTCKCLGIWNGTSNCKGANWILMIVIATEIMTHIINLVRAAALTKSRSLQLEEHWCFWLSCVSWDRYVCRFVYIAMRYLIHSFEF